MVTGKPDNYQINYREFPNVNNQLPPNTTWDALQDFRKDFEKSIPDLSELFEEAVANGGDYDKISNVRSLKYDIFQGIRDIDNEGTDQVLEALDNWEAGLKSIGQLDSKAKAGIDTLRDRANNIDNIVTRETLEADTRSAIDQVLSTVPADEVELRGRLNRVADYSGSSARSGELDNVNEYISKPKDYKTGREIIESSDNAFEFNMDKLDKAMASIEDAMPHANLEILAKDTYAKLKRLKEEAPLLEPMQRSERMQDILNDARKITEDESLSPSTTFDLNQAVKYAEGTISKAIIETRTPKVDMGAMAQLDKAMGAEISASPYGSGHMGTTEPMYLRTNDFTSPDGSKQLIIQEPQSDAFAAGDKFKLKKDKRMPYGNDWLEKDMEDAVMKAMNEGHDEIVIPLHKKDSDTDIYTLGDSYQDALRKGNEAGWDDKFMSSKTGKKLKGGKYADENMFHELPIEMPPTLPDRGPFRDAGGREAIGIERKSKSTTTPIYYNKNVVEATKSIADRLGLPKEAISFKDHKGTTSIVIDMRDVEPGQTFSIYGKPGEFKGK